MISLGEDATEEEFLPLRMNAYIILLHCCFLNDTVIMDQQIYFNH